MLSSIFFTLTYLFCLFAGAVDASDITTFTDDKCTRSFNNLDTTNGYPDGLCKQLGITGNLKTFQIAKLDPGCAVTLYGPNSNELSCSSGLQIVADLATCYNSSWVYYSIDGCLPPSSSSIVLPSVTPLQSSAQTSSTTSATSVPASPPNFNHTGAIVGGIVGGVAVFALIVLGVVLLLRRRSKPLSSPPPEYELSNSQTRLELAYPEKVIRHEIGSNDAYVPPAELPGDSLSGQDKKGINPLVKIHMVK